MMTETPVKYKSVMNLLVKKASLFTLLLVLLSGCRQPGRIRYLWDEPQLSFPLYIDGNNPPSGSPVPPDKTNLIRLNNPSFLGSWKNGNYDYHLFMGLNARADPTLKVVSSIRDRKYREETIYVYDRDQSRGSDIILRSCCIDYRNYKVASTNKENTRTSSFIFQDGKLIERPVTVKQ